MCVWVCVCVCVCKCVCVYKMYIISICEARTFRVMVRNEPDTNIGKVLSEGK